VQDDGLLLERAQAFDLDALASIYDKYAPPIYRYIFRYLGDGPLAEDITGEVFARLLDAIERGKGPRDNLSAWLYRVAHNLAVDHLRQRSHAEGLPLEEGLMAAPDDPTAVVEKRLAQQRLRAAISHLTPIQQQVIVLKFLEGFSNEEVGKILGKREGAVKSLQHRALASLRRILQKQEGA
jgi:RNA polymerase sigma-70 factor (ECF subfamily)